MTNKHIEEIARQLHIWYLDATKKLNSESYNPNAQKSYDDLTEEQKDIDRYIAQKVLEYGDQREREGREAGTKVWAVVMDDGFIPTFNVEGKFDEVMQIHGNKKSAEALVAELGEGWRTQECRVVLH